MKYFTKEQINKGWSSDRKYCLTDENGSRYLLRVSDIAQLGVKQQEFDMMKRVASLGVPMCMPIEFGVCEDSVYSVQSWIDGVDAEEVMKKLSDTEQYEYGLEAGRILRKIHSIPAPAEQEDWESRFNRKIDNKIKKYSECPIKCDNGQAFIEYINANRGLLKNRLQVYQHGDYHIGNMMIDRDGRLIIIDFNRKTSATPGRSLIASFGLLKRLLCLPRAWWMATLMTMCRTNSGSCLLCISQAIRFHLSIGRFRLEKTR